MLTLLDLFAGVGSFSLAAHRTEKIRTEQFVEIAKYPQAILSKNFPGVPCHADVKTYNPSQRFDIITAGFPCQDISAAGHKEGLRGERSSLFFEIVRIAKESGPEYIVLENSPRLLSSRQGADMREILRALSAGGYDAEWSVVSACALGAPHMRKRLLIVAYSNCIIRPKGLAFQRTIETKIQEILSRPCVKAWKNAEARAIRRPVGATNWMDKHRRKAVGNTVAPLVAELALHYVLTLAEEN